MYKNVTDTRGCAGQSTVQNYARSQVQNIYQLFSSIH